MELVICNNGKATTTSVKVAEYFGKQHKNVITAIEKLREDPSVEDRLNFKPVSYMDTMNRLQLMYDIDRDGFTLLAMGFTGKQALQFKLSYIDAFNKAEKALMTDTSSLTPQLQLAHAMLLAGNMIEEQKSQIEQRDKFISVIQPKADIADRINTSDGLFGFRQVAKTLSLNENKLRAWLIQNDWIYYLGGRMTAKAPILRKGYADTKVKLIQVDGHDDKTIVDMFFTSKGLVQLTSVFGQPEC